MKKIFIMLSMLIFGAIQVYADGMVYDPTEYSSSATDVKEIPSNAEISSNIKSTANYAQETVSGQSENFNNALFQLDSAQVNIRNELLDYKAKYQELDTQYKLIKEQRRVLGKQIKNVEKKVKAIEKSKNHIRKTMI